MGDNKLFSQKKFIFKQNSNNGFNCMIKQASDNIDLHTVKNLKVNGYFVPTDSKYTLTVESYPIWLPVDKLANNSIDGHDVSEVRWNNTNAYQVKLTNVVGGATRYFSKKDGIFIGSTLKTKKVLQNVVLSSRS
jgi:hypothetical protein